MNLLIRLLSILLKGVVLLLLCLFLIGLIPYLFTTTYHFPDSKKFQGENVYNPYEITDTTIWLKANLQVQSHAWGGITDGRKNSNKQIYDTYKFLDYDLIGISDYMRINSYGQDQESYLPIYEHGYNLFKRHQICIGSASITYFDFPFFQSIDHKQQLINKLNLNTDYLCLAHPVLMNSYTVADFKQLRNYHSIEIESIFGSSQAHWDAVLSEGNYVTALGNDDAHDLSKPVLVGRFCTMINAEAKQVSILNSLKNGNAYVVVIKENFDAEYKLKKISHQKLQKLKRLDFKNDSIFIEVSEPGFIRFIGQGGILMQKNPIDSIASYRFKKGDSYIRIEVEFKNGNLFYLNPLIRYNQKIPDNQLVLKVNYLKTWIYRFGFFILIVLNLFSIRWTYKRFKIFRK